MLRGKKLSFHSLLLHSSGWEGLGAVAINSKKLSCFGHQANQILTPWMLEYMAHHSSCYAAERKIKEDKEDSLQGENKALTLQGLSSHRCQVLPTEIQAWTKLHILKGPSQPKPGAQSQQEAAAPTSSTFQRDCNKRTCSI